MKYRNIVKGSFLERPNRFIARVEIEGRQETVHVKNTGRCAELLTSGATVYLEKSDNQTRSTAYDLVAVEKNGRMINMDSQAPNKVVKEWLATKQLFKNLTFVHPETKYGNSRFDFYIEAGEKKIFMEVKGVTLEQDNVVSFPDAPSERALKHVEELVRAKEEGYEAYVLFVVQMEGVAYFTPNSNTQPAFAEILAWAAQKGVGILAYDCTVTADSMTIREPVCVKLPQIISAERKIRKGEIKDICKPLLAWYDTSRRILPWREDATPYRVWVSEIMLQQTRVEAVKPYFERFMAALPDISSLANAQEEDLLKLWEGLGYYNRVRNMQKAAQRILYEYGGNMPKEYAELHALPGIGSYTAGAIASIAFGQRMPAVDGNVLRVVSRYAMRRDDILLPAVKTQVEKELLAIMPERAGDFNQAMMEIGAMVCIPNGAPHCDQCPLQDGCMAYDKGAQTEYPVKGRKKPRTIEEKTVLVIRDENTAALHKRPSQGLLAGMYELPSLDGHKSAEEVLAVLEQMGLHSLRIVPLTDSRHIFTHKEWHMKGYMIRVDELAPKSDSLKGEDWIFADTKEVEEKYPVPAAFAAYARYLNIKLGNEKYRRRDRI